jgi:serine/threonine protein kinase
MVLQSSFRETYFEQAESKWILRAPTTIFGQQSERGALYDNRLSFSSRIRKRTLTESIGNYDLFEDLLKKMLTIDPLERISPEAALNHPLFCTTTQGEPKELKEYGACSSPLTVT